VIKRQAVNEGLQILKIWKWEKRRVVTWREVKKRGGRKEKWREEETRELNWNEENEEGRIVQSREWNRKGRK
jgi:hypothetical protein